MFDRSIPSNDDFTPTMFSAATASETRDDASEATTPPRSWREVDHALRELARCRSALDADEARLLCIAARDEIWRQLGRGSFYEYLEEVLGHSPRSARERVRVARALADLPALEVALANGELHWSAVRELTRVATPETVDAWLDVARGKNLRQIEEAVAGRIKGDRPDDPPKPDKLTRRVTMELRLDTLALLGRARERFADERGEVPDEDMLIAALCNAYLDGDESAGDSGRAKFQLMTVVCPSCDRAAHESAGRRMPIDAADRARAECDAQRIGSDAAPGRATQDVSPKTRRFVRRRDGGKCCVPTCRASRYLEIHHIVPREAGGSHEPDNLTLICDAHHRAYHQGKLLISGKAPALEVRWTHPCVADTSQRHRETTHVGRDVNARSPLATAERVGGAISTLPTTLADPTIAVVPKPPSTAECMQLIADAQSALVTDLRFPKHIARAAIDAALAELEPTPTLGALIFAAVRRCSKHD
jgi:hypothetical protein